MGSRAKRLPWNSQSWLFFLFVFFPPQRRENPVEVSRIKCILEGKCGDVEELLGVWERELALPVRLLRSSAPTVGFGGVRDVWELGRSRQESGGAGWEVQPWRAVQPLGCTGCAVAEFSDLSGQKTFLCLQMSPEQLFELDCSEATHLHFFLSGGSNSGPRNSRKKHK